MCGYIPQSGNVLPVYIKVDGGFFFFIFFFLFLYSTKKTPLLFDGSFVDEIEGEKKT